MATYIHLSRVYLSDTELYELISAKNFPTRKLRSRMRERGLFYSDKGREEDVRSRIAFLPSDWQLVAAILSEIASPDPRERRTTQRITNYVPDQDIAAAVTKVQDERSQKYGEVYNKTVTSDGITRIEVSYTELDYSRAVPYQRRQRKVTVEVVAAGETLDVRYDANGKASQIVEGLKSALQYKEKDTPTVHKISLNGIRDPVTRTKFFTELIKEIRGFRYENTTHIAVDRRMPTEEEEGETGSTDATALQTENAVEEQKKRKIEEQIKGLINKVSLTGEQVLASELYDKAASSGYYIAAIHWTCVSESDPRIHIDCEAALVDPPAGEPFSFDFVRQWRDKADDHDKTEIEAVDSDQRRRYEDLIEAAAQKAFSAVSAELKSPSETAASAGDASATS